MASRICFRLVLLLLAHRYDFFFLFHFPGAPSLYIRRLVRFGECRLITRHCVAAVKLSRAYYYRKNVITSTFRARVSPTFLGPFRDPPRYRDIVHVTHVLYYYISKYPLRRVADSI